MQRDGIKLSHIKTMASIMNKYSSAVLLLTCATLFSASLSAQTIPSSDLVAPERIEKSELVTVTPGLKYPPLSPDEIKQINSQMNGQILANEKRLQQYRKTSKNPSKSLVSDEIETEINIQKEILSNLQESPSWRSPKVRQAFMHFLRKDHYQLVEQEGDFVRMTTMADLYFLQRVAEAEMPYTDP